MVFQIRKFDPEKHHRQSCRISGYDFSQPGSYFITLKSYYNAKIFGKISGKLMVLNDLGKIVYDEWVKAQIIRTNIRLDEFTIMPDHFHGILIITYPDTLQKNENDDNIQFRCANQNNKCANQNNKCANQNNKCANQHNKCANQHNKCANQHNKCANQNNKCANQNNRRTQQRAPICIDQNQININHNRSNVNYSQFITRKSNMIYNGRQLFSFFHEPIISDFKRHVHDKSEQFGKPTKNTIPSIIRGFKSTVTKQINENNGTPGKAVWQRSYYLRIIETQNEFYRTSTYIKENPQNRDTGH